MLNVIYKNIPVPPKSQPKGTGKWQKLAAQMKRGDSVLVEEYSGLYSAIRNSGFKAITRQEGDVFRVWKGPKIV